MANPTNQGVRFSASLGPKCCWIFDGPSAGGCKDKWEVIQKMLDAFVAAERVAAERRGAIHAALVEREKSISTGMEGGIALPHAAIDALGDLVTGLAVFRDGVPFQSIDGSPARIIVMLLIPKDRRIVYLPVLAEAARLLSRAEVRDKLLEVASRESAGSESGAAALFDIIGAAERSVAARA